MYGDRAVRPRSGAGSQGGIGERGSRRRNGDEGDKQVGRLGRTKLVADQAEDETERKKPGDEEDERARESSVAVERGPDWLHAILMVAEAGHEQYEPSLTGPTEDQLLSPRMAKGYRFLVDRSAAKMAKLLPKKRVLSMAKARLPKDASLCRRPGNVRPSLPRLSSSQGRRWIGSPESLGHLDDRLRGG